MAVNTYYFDGSDAGASNTGVGTDWSNTTNADDGNTATDATVTLSSFADSKELLIEGTNAPSSGGTITQVRARVYGLSAGGTTLLTDITTDGDAEEIYSNLSAPITSEGWSSYVTLSTPTGGWTWAKIQSLESRSTGNGGFDGGSVTLSRVEIEISSYTNDTGWVSPGTASSDSSVGTVDWDNPENIVSSDDSDARASALGSSITPP